MSRPVFPDSKQHFEILDGLRGVAAIMVVMFHLLEIFSGGDHSRQMINHGYLAVDFFFLLSGFVIGHAYDDRWNKMTTGQFFRRRLIRLHPLIIIGMTIGAICFYFSDSAELFPHVAGTPVWKLLLLLVIGYFLIPVPLSLDIRGWEEMYPLNGPAWSLFYEYVANILYAFIFRRAATRLLAVLVFLAGSALAYYSITSPGGDVIGGWSLTAAQMKIGFLRLLYPFLAGLLLSRLFRPAGFKSSFLLCSILVIVFLSIPRVGGISNHWLNGVYDAGTIILIFPLIVFLGANGTVKEGLASKICSFLGDISYPLYIIHFPLMYVFYARVVNNKVPLHEAWPLAALALAVSVTLAWICFRFYDVPVRKWLTKKYLHSGRPRG